MDRFTGILGAVAVIVVMLAAAGGAARPATASAAPAVCVNGVCDGGKDPSTAAEDKQLEPTFQWNRRIILHLSYPDNMGWASIDTGNPGDEVWLDRTFDVGQTWDSKLGDTFIPTGSTSWRTQMYFLNDPARGNGRLRACGKAGDRPEIACTQWLPTCGASCDGKDPAAAGGDKLLEPVTQWNRNIVLHISYPDGMGWANIDTANPGDEVWVDRSFDAGHTWDSKLGDTFVPSGWTSWRTWMFNINDPARGAGQLRACGKAGDRPEINCTAWLPVCRATCDGKDPATAAGDRAIDPLSWVWFRKITLHMSDADHMAWASIENGQATDEVWIDRSWDGGSTWESKLGDTFIPSGDTGWRTWMYYFDDPAHGGSGVLRACGKAGNRTEIGCTPWIHAADATPDTYQAAVSSLLVRYNPSISNWDNSGGWWHSANAVTALVDYTARTGDCSHWSYVESTFNNNQGLFFGNYTNSFYDDTGWWAMAWMRASDVAATCAPGEVSQYLTMAEKDFAYMQGGWDTSSTGPCGRPGGGLWWNTTKEYKATIANGLFMELAAGLYNRTGVSSYLTWAQADWTWLTQQNLIASNGLIVDGYHTNCSVTADTWTYVQGTFIGGLVGLYEATGNASYLNSADGLAQATVTNLVYGSGDPRAGVLRENCEPPGVCLGISTDDASSFKGIFVRQLRPLYDQEAALGRSTFGWAGFMTLQTRSMVANDRSGWGEYGFHWGGPVRLVTDDNFATQASALDAFNAAAGL